MIDDNTRQIRSRYLDLFGATLAANVTNPAAVSNPIRLQPDSAGFSIDAISGPRVGALEVLAGIDTGRLLRILTSDGMAFLRQLVPWEFTHAPSCYLSGRRVRVEVAWPQGLQEDDVTLGSLGQCPEHSGLIIAGINERGSTIRLRLGDQNPHLLIGGATGSGKSWAMRSIAAQLGRDGNLIILLDGKWGEGLGPINGLPGQVGPIATEAEDIRSALGWAYGEMRRRYTTKEVDPPALIILFDEFQEFTRAGDQAIIELLRRLGAQGRAANVHIVAGTQHPTVDVFGDHTTRRHFTARIAMKVGDYSASEAVVGGSNPRADQNLLGSGDAYVITPNATQRVQMAYVPNANLRQYVGTEPALDRWPTFGIEDLGNAGPQAGRPQEPFGEDQIAESVIAASRGDGRDTLIQRIRDAGGRIGSGRATRLLAMGSEINRRLQLHNYCRGLSAPPPESEDMGKARPQTGKSEVGI